jgi:Heterokaryon incompatibility protein (HET)
MSLTSASLNVVVWLGEADDWSDSAMRLIRVLAASWRADEGEALAKAIVENPLAWHTTVKPAEGSLMCCWDGLRSLMRRPYWKRVWVVQEMAMGDRKSLMLCEEECVDFGQLCDATVSWMGRYATIVSKLMLYDSSMHGALGRYGRGGTNLTLSRDDPAAVVNAFRQLMTDVRGVLDYMQAEIWVFDSDRITFIERLAEQVGGASVMCAPPSNLIGLGRASEASRPQDKIYGFLSLMDPEFASHFKVDYRQSAAEVYTIFSIYWTKWSKTLDLFVHCFLEHSHSPS